MNGEMICRMSSRIIWASLLALHLLYILPFLFASRPLNTVLERSSKQASKCSNSLVMQGGIPCCNSSNQHEYCSSPQRLLDQQEMDEKRLVPTGANPLHNR
eukprot:c20847_g1_i1 orf=459-761(-)